MKENLMFVAIGLFFAVISDHRLIISTKFKINLLPLFCLLSNIIFLLKIFLQKLVLDGNIETRYADFLNSIKDKVNHPMVSANGKWYWFVNISLFHNIHSLKRPSILFISGECDCDLQQIPRDNNYSPLSKVLNKRLSQSRFTFCHWHQNLHS